MIMHDKAFNIAKNPKYDGYQRGLALMLYTFFYKTPVTHMGTGINSNSDSENQQLAEKLHRVREFVKC